MGDQEEEKEQIVLGKQGLGRLEWEDQTWRKRGGGGQGTKYGKGQLKLGAI